MPSTSKCRRCWNSRTARSVEGPNSACSSASMANPSATSRDWTSITASPRAPRATTLTDDEFFDTGPTSTLLGATFRGVADAGTPGSVPGGGSGGQVWLDLLEDGVLAASADEARS